MIIRYIKHHWDDGLFRAIIIVWLVNIAALILYGEFYLSSIIYCVSMVIVHIIYRHYKPFVQEKKNKT